MERIDALMANADKLALKASEYRDRIDLFRRKGASAEVTIAMLIATCAELGAIAAVMKSELDKIRNAEKADAVKEEPSVGDPDQ